MVQRTVFPLAAIVGQDSVKQALLIAAVNPKAGGVLVTGEKGTAKSTLVRALSEVTGKARIIELPLSATEDMVFGGLDLQQAVGCGERRFLPGILARAHHHILYIDEINLLRREFVNVLQAASLNGIHRVEREGISCRHEAVFSLIGTMNPEEGALAPPTIDRFGLYAAANREQDAQARVEIVRRCLAYERDPAGFRRQYAVATEAIRQRVVVARQLLPAIVVPETMVLLAARMCAKAHSAGHRAELFLLEAARTLAALAGRDYLVPADMETAACYVLPQRMRQEQEPPPPPPPPEQSEGQNQEQQQDQQQDQQQPFTQQENQQQEEQPDSAAAEQSPAEGNDQEKVADIDTQFPFIQMELALPQDRQERHGSGKRSLTRTDTKQGRYVRAGIPPGTVTDLAFDATLRAAAPYQRFRDKGNCCIAIEREDLRQKIREKRIGSTFLFVVDASGSMGARERMRAVKGAVCAMLQDAYQKRDQVGLIAFRRQSAEVLLPVTRSVDLAQKCLRHLPTGGKTPLAEGLAAALTVLAARRKKEQDMRPVLVLVTDGRANTAAAGGNSVDEALAMAARIREAGIHSVVIDTESDFIKLGLARTVARKMGASYYSLGELSDKNIMHIVRNLP